jgi:DNA (cytosine-5)-methyltransferase 1
MAIQQNANEGLRELALFAGAGGGILGGHLLGWRTICAVEWDAYAASVLVARQNDGCLPPFPIWDDVQTFDGRPWRGRVDVVSGGFPCQDISAAGKGAGIDGARSGMWGHMARIVREVGPRYVFVENSPMLTSRGLGRVLGDLAAMGYDAQWGVLGAVDAGAPHKRERIWIVGELADSAQLQRNGREHHPRISSRCESFSELRNRSWQTDVGNAEMPRLTPCIVGSKQEQPWRTGCGITWWKTEPDVGRVAHGVAARVDRLRCLGNGQVPAVVRLAWETLNA